MTTCFDRKTVIFRPIKNVSLKYNKLSTQWDPISFTVNVKIAYDETLNLLAPELFFDFSTPCI